MPHPKPHLGILGFGQFGQYLARILSRWFTILAHDPNADSAAPRNAHANLVSLQTLATSPIIILAVPIAHLPAAAKSLAAHLDPNYSGIIIDVTSVKLEPIRVLPPLLPPDARLFFTHPLFGPQSAPTSMRGHTAAICHTRADAHTTRRVTAFLERRLGLRLIVIDADEHDKEMAIVQGLTHYIAQALRTLNLRDTPLATASYRHLLALQQTLSQDSWPLFETISRHNPHAPQVREQLRASLTEVERRLHQQP